MATLTIRNVPKDLHEALKDRAKKNLRSLNQEVISELMKAIAVETDEERRARVGREIAAANKLRSRAKCFLTAEETDDAKRAGRA